MPELLPLPVNLIVAAVYLVLLVAALPGLDLAGLARDPARQHRFFAASLIVMLFWLVRAGITPGLSIHFLGMTALTLVVGWRLALLGSLFPLLGTRVLGLEEWILVGWSGLLFCALPIGVTELARRLAGRLPANLFVYVFVCAFFGAMLATGCARLAVAGLLWGLDAVPAETVWDEYLLLLPLTLFPEAILNGMVISVLAVYRPGWLHGFDQRRYLGG